LNAITSLSLKAKLNPKNGDFFVVSKRENWFLSIAIVGFSQQKNFAIVF